MVQITAADLQSAAVDNDESRPDASAATCHIVGHMYMPLWYNQGLAISSRKASNSVLLIVLHSRPRGSVNCCFV